MKNLQREAAENFSLTYFMSTFNMLIEVKVKHQPHKDGKFGECFHNAYDLVKTDYIQFGYVISSRIQSGIVGYSIIPHYWSVDPKTKNHIDRTPYPDFATKFLGVQKDWIYLAASNNDSLLLSEQKRVGTADHMLNPYLLSKDKELFFVSRVDKKELANGEEQVCVFTPIDNIFPSSLYNLWRSKNE